MNGKTEHFPCKVKNKACLLSLRLFGVPRAALARAGRHAAGMNIPVEKGEVRVPVFTNVCTDAKKGL